MSYNSKYTGKDIEDAIEKTSMALRAEETNDSTEERNVMDAVYNDEKVFLKSSAKHTYMNDGISVEEALSNLSDSGVEKLTIVVSGITDGFTIYVMSENGDIIDTQSSLTKTYRIKEGTKYYATASDEMGYWAPAPMELRTAYPYVSFEYEFVYERKYITTIRIDQTLLDPASMISKIVDTGGIEHIRANSHRYTGEFKNDIMRLKQLDDDNGTKYLDGSDAQLTTVGVDVWMKLPKFYWKCEEYNTDVWDFSVIYGNCYDDSYKEWDGKDLIGVYEAVLNSLKLYSYSGKASTSGQTYSTFNSYANNRGTGFSTVKWKHHCMMAMLFYAYYGNTNSQAIVGSGTSSYTKVTGLTNSIGMNDTIASEIDGVSSINFWGLENWWGNKSEYICNMLYGYQQKLKITEDDSSVRNIDFTPISGWVTKMKFGEFADLLPTSTNGSNTTGFCDEIAIPTYSYEYFLRSGYKNNNTCGVSFLENVSSSGVDDSTVGTRIAFRGEIIIES